MAAMSWNSSTENAVTPVGAVSMLRSRIVWIAIAVDDSASAKPVTSAPFQGNPTATPPAPSSSPQAAICSAPPPKTARRMAYRRLGSSSRPMRNSMSTTPNSAKCMISFTSRSRPKPNGPMAQPAMR